MRRHPGGHPVLSASGAGVGAGPEAEEGPRPNLAPRKNPPGWMEDLSACRRAGRRHRRRPPGPGLGKAFSQKESLMDGPLYPNLQGPLGQETVRQGQTRPRPGGDTCKPRADKEPPSPQGTKKQNLEGDKDAPPTTPIHTALESSPQQSDKKRK